ncbi:hypothetical protein BV898_17394 [Hypsibius exemplaris]|uniref:Uncharacterized protein n=1 Tax=Hypsibius exemplaris TaxID=2072580 RepID=A0A9X6RLZ9_HYPEX|nr:hypothetical protein BV898_17394 [Hypsibius exemplaris]
MDGLTDGPPVVTAVGLIPACKLTLNGDACTSTNTPNSPAILPAARHTSNLLDPQAQHEKGPNCHVPLPCTRPGWAILPEQTLSDFSLTSPSSLPDPNTVGTLAQSISVPGIHVRCAAQRMPHCYGHGRTPMCRSTPAAHTPTSDSPYIPSRSTVQTTARSQHLSGGQVINDRQTTSRSSVKTVRRRLDRPSRPSDDVWIVRQNRHTTSESSFKTVRRCLDRSSRPSDYVWIIRQNRHTTSESSVKTVTRRLDRPSRPSDDAWIVRQTVRRCLDRPLKPSHDV